VSEEREPKTDWFAELRRRRLFRAMAAYFVGAWVLLQIANVTFPPLGLPDWWQRALIIALVVGAVPVFVLAWIYDVTAHGVVRTPPTTPAASPEQSDTEAVAGLVGTRAALAADSLSRPDASVAVLPFTDLSAERDQDWFCDGLAEEIIDALTCVRHLRVASRTASFRFRDGSVDPREIGRQLRVGAILEGSVRRAGERVRISAQLIDADNGYHLWSESYDRRIEDVFAIQIEIARKVSAALRVSLTGDEAARRERYAPRNAQAHEFYLRGRQLGGRISHTTWQQAPAMFRRAIELDPDYAQAYAGLADVLAQNMLWRFERAEDILPEATRAAHRALELAPDLAEAHVALGHVRSLTGDNEGAKRSFERALELNPELFEAYYYFARHCLAHGEFLRAAELFRASFEVRPEDYTVLALIPATLESAGEHERAQAVAREALEGLKHQIELDPEDVRALYMLAGTLARVGQREAGLPYVERALKLRPDDYATVYNAACFYSLAGDTNRALDLLERIGATGSGNREWIERDNDLAGLRGHPRFEALLANLDAAKEGAAVAVH
jgi:adenylate cyclase